MEMDKSEMEKIDETVKIDNSKLEALLKKDFTPDVQKEFIELFKQSNLFMPVTYSANMFEGIENVNEGDIFEPEGQVGFDINYLTDHDGNKAVPLFTSSEVMESVGARTSAIVIYMSDLVEMLKQTDNYSIISINPFTEFDLNMPIQSFYNMFKKFDFIEEIRHDKLRELMKNGLGEESEELFSEELFKSTLILPCVSSEDKINFVLIRDENNIQHLPLFTDVDEFEKMFADYEGDVFPQAYKFEDLISVADEDLVINPTSESLVLNAEILKK